MSALLIVIAASMWTGFDLWLADHAFYDGQRWLGGGTWWAEDLIHSGGRDFVAVIAILALAGLAASFVSRRARDWRRGAAFVFLSIALSTGIVGALKNATHVDCPRDLQRYGGPHPYIELFADRPDKLPRARCFPGAHSSSAFSLMCFYFLLRPRRRRAARAALADSLILAALFSFGQQARGAHFISHDLAGALVVWCVLLALSSAFGLNREVSSSAAR